MCKLTSFPAGIYTVMDGLCKGGVAYLDDLVELGQQAVPGLSGGKILLPGGRLCLNIIYNKKQWRVNFISLNSNSPIGYCMIDSGAIETPAIPALQGSSTSVIESLSNCPSLLQLFTKLSPYSTPWTFCSIYLF